MRGKLVCEAFFCLLRWSHKYGLGDFKVRLEFKTHRAAENAGLALLDDCDHRDLALTEHRPDLKGTVCGVPFEIVCPSPPANAFDELPEWLSEVPGPYDTRRYRK